VSIGSLTLVWCSCHDARLASPVPPPSQLPVPKSTPSCSHRASSLHSYVMTLSVQLLLFKYVDKSSPLPSPSFHSFGTLSLNSLCSTYSSPSPSQRLHHRSRATPSPIYTCSVVPGIPAAVADCLIWYSSFLALGVWRVTDGTTQGHHITTLHATQHPCGLSGLPLPFPTKDRPHIV